MKIRALIVDDEELARDRMRFFLSQEDHIEILGECATGPDAIRFIREHRPDLVFLDIQMPEVSGFDVLRSLPPAEMPAIIFVTAHDQHAIEAFEVHALDYLVKPLSRTRFQEAVRRARAHTQSRRLASLDDRLQDLVGGPRVESVYPNRIPVRSGNQTLFIKLDAIDYIESAANYMVLHTQNGNHILRQTLTSLEAKLPSRLFLRISRSIIVNLDRIKGWESNPRGDYELLLHNNQRLVMTRGTREIQERLQYARS